VRVAPGETLATIAQRFYGDAAQADRIWEANRDQLRSPELVVAGMELRLP
jgi:nucleoid-associated protein YgaU